MSDIAIKVENISKRYRIGLKEELHDTFLGALTSWIRYPISNFKRVQKLSKFNEDSDSEDIIWALRDVSLEVKRGEVLGLIGRNGAGKSTLLKILCRITEPTSGQAIVHGRISSLLEVGTGFHPELTGRENVYLNGTILGMRKTEIDRKFNEIVAFAEIEKFIDTPVKRYSSGMYVRLAFAVAAHLEPDILLVDEVLAVGDVAFQKKCLGRMEDMARGGRTVLFISHNMGAVSNLCQKAILLSSGQLAFYGDVNECVNTYLTGFEKIEGLDTVERQIEQLPPDRQFHLRSLSLCQGGQPGSEFLSHIPIDVKIEYDILDDIEYLRIGFDLFASDGTVVFRSFDDDDPIEGSRFRQQGYYKSVAIIPEDFLAIGVYTLDLAVGIHKVRWIINGEIKVSFQVIQTVGVNSHYADERPGVIMPLLRWEINHIYES